MLLTELTETPRPWKWETNGSDYAKAVFNTSDKHVYAMTFQSHSSMKHDMWQVSFGTYSYDASKKTIEVLSTIKRIMLTFIKEKQPGKVFVTSRDEQLTRIFKYMIQSVSGDLAKAGYKFVQNTANIGYFEKVNHATH